MTSTDLLETMRTRLAEAEAEAQKLRDAIAVFDDNSNAAAPRRRKTAASKRPTVAHPTETEVVVPLGKLISSLRNDPGQSASRLAKESAGDQKSILALLKEAEQAGKVRREGERRGTVWFVVSDDDKVAAKTAEIEARIRAPKTPRKRSPHQPVMRKSKAETSTPKSDEDAPASTASAETASESTAEIATAAA